MTNALTNIDHQTKTTQSQIWLINKAQEPLLFRTWFKTTSTRKKKGKGQMGA
jgi:P pilus assembly chaperone PapD